MEILINLELEDWKAFQSYITKSLNKKSKSGNKGFFFNLIISFIFAFVFMAIFQNFSEIHWPSAGAVFLPFIVIFTLFVLSLFKLRKASEPSDDGVFIGKHKFIFDEAGFKIYSKGYEGSYKWDVVKNIERSDGMIIIFLDTIYSYVFPENKLENPDDFFNFIQNRHKNITTL